MRRGTLPHLLLRGTAIAVAGYAVAQIVRGGHAVNFAAWFVGAALLHDLVLLPLYSSIDRLLHRRGRWRRAPVPAVNHIRVPALISGLLLLVYFPLILGLSRHNYLAATGHPPSGYLRGWLAITVALFAASALLYGVRRTRSRR